ncbi:MAG: hypothetical protein ABIR84_06235 [Candidatus Nitrotoga sp.]
MSPHFLMSYRTAAIYHLLKNQIAAIYLTWMLQIGLTYQIRPYQILNYQTAAIYLTWMSQIDGIYLTLDYSNLLNHISSTY